MSSNLRSSTAVNDKFSKHDLADVSMSPVSIVLKALAVILLSAALGFLLSCTKKSTPSAGGDSATAQGGDRVVNLAIWANYLTPEMQAKFTKETGIQLRVSNFSSSEELLAKLQSGAAGIDVAVPSDYMVGVMTKLSLLAPLDASKIPNKASTLR